MYSREGGGRLTPEKGSENEKKIFVFVLNKYQSVTHASITIFQRIFKFLDM